MLHPVISIQKENVIACRILQRFISRCGKIINPFKVMHLSAIALCYLYSVIRRTRIHYHNLVKHIFYRLKAMRQIFRFVFNYHAERERRFLKAHLFLPFPCRNLFLFAQKHLSNYEISFIHFQGRRSP